MRYSVVITTRFLPKVIEDFARNIDIYGRKNDVEIIIIGDVKSPSESAEYVSGFSRNGFNFEYWDIQRQEEWLRQFPDLHAMIPYNSDNRRNIGYLLAYERGRECIVALDDDNYPTKDDYFAGHEKVGKRQKAVTVRSNTGWFNVCDLLEIEGGVTVYPRGFPYKFRGLEHTKYDQFESEGNIVVNAGLWLGDPDIDAVTRLNYPVNAIGLKTESLMLDPSTNCPFNTQNTAFHRDILPSYYYVVMGYPLGSLKIDRYGDIWSSYLSRKVIDRMDGRIAFGIPLTRHLRHAHDLLKDLGQEYWGMVITNRLIDILSTINLVKDSYGDCYHELSLALEERVRETEDFTEEVKSFFFMICKNMRIWVDICSDLEGRTK